MRPIPLLSFAAIALCLAATSTAEQADVTWKVFLSHDEQASAKGFLAGPAELESGHTIVPEQGLVEVRSRQGGTSTAGFAYAASPLPQQYELTFHYTVLVAARHSAIAANDKRGMGLMI